MLMVEVKVNRVKIKKEKRPGLYRVTHNRFF